MQCRLAKRTLFRTIRHEVETQLREHFSAYLDRARQHVDEVCDAIEQSIQTVLLAEAGTEKTSPESLEQVKALVAESRREWELVEADSQRARREARKVLVV